MTKAIFYSVFLGKEGHFGIMKMFRPRTLT